MLRSLPSHLAALLRSCIAAKALRPGKQVHAQMVVAGVGTDVGTLYSKLIGVYASSGDKESSNLLFQRVEKPTAFAWNWIILAAAFRGDYGHALHTFSHMLSTAGIYPNKFTFSYALKACIGLFDINRGKELHCIIAVKGFESDVLVTNALLDMYCKCGSMKFARQLFDRMAIRDVISWTSMICGYFKTGDLKESSLLFERMRSQGMKPNDFTWNAMISGYAQNGDFEKASRLFKETMSEGLGPDIVSWNAMIAGFVQNDWNSEALSLFGEMVTSGLRPNVVTITGLLPVCAKIGSLAIGKQVHCLIYRTGLKSNIFTETALVDMYSKCGNTSHARRVFDQMKVRNVATYNAMIDCYGKHGIIDVSIELFERMQREGIEADKITFTCILSACSHVGLVGKGLEIFRHLTKDGRLELTIEHYACMVDLLSRSGNLEGAYELVKKMPIAINDSIVGAFVSGCRIHGRSDMAEMMAKDLRGSTGSVFLSNIYAENGRWERVEGVKTRMRKQGVHKVPGCSWLEENEGSVGFVME